MGGLEDQRFTNNVGVFHKNGWEVPLEDVSDAVACDGKDGYIGFFFTLYIPNDVIPESLHGSGSLGGLKSSKTGGDICV